MFELLCLQQEVIGSQINGRLALESLNLRKLQPRFYSRDHTCGDVILEFEHVAHFAFETISPDLRACCCIDQLPKNAQSISGSSNAAFHDVTHTEVTPDLTHINRSPLVSE